VPGERERCLAIVYNKLYDAWRRPSLSPTEVAKPAELTIWLGDSGVIKKYKLTRSSGNRELDASVESAAKAVRRIPGLTSDFIKEYKTITINFVLE
jgi:TonB family protein